MTELREYRRKVNTPVTAVQLALETDGFTYRKWGGIQTASAGDWLVNNGGDVYTVERQTFQSTYKEVEPGRYEKVQSVWASVAEEDGAVRTKEGETEFRAGDVIVFNDPEGRDGYAMSRGEFDRLYEPAS